MKNIKTNVSKNVLNPGNQLGFQYFLPNSNPQLGYNQVSGNTSLSGSNWELRRDGLTHVEEALSFSSAWEYHLEQLLLVNILPVDTPFGPIDISIREALKLTALGIAPENFNSSALYALTSYSWLLDWFTSVGDVIALQNALQSNGLSCLYAYATSHARFRANYSWSLWQNGTHRLQGEVQFTRKRVLRRRATPFGFHVSFDSLNLNQIGILSALAASKVR